MTDKTIKALVEYHNQLAERLALKPLEYWKKAKADLEALVDELEGKVHELDLAQQARDDEAEKTATVASAKPKNPNRGKVCTMIRDLLVDPAQYSYLDIVKMVIQAHPLANTSTRSVASIAADLRRDGVAVAMRKAIKQTVKPVDNQPIDDGVTGD